MASRLWYLPHQHREQAHNLTILSSLTVEAECDRPAGSALDRAVPLVELYVDRKALFARDKEALAPWGLVQRG